MTFKPKKQQIHVPGFGVVQKEDFEQKHFDILMKRAADRDAFIKQHFVVDSYGDQPLFVEVEKENKPKGKERVKKETAVSDDDKELEKLIAEEEAEKENASESAE